MSRELKWHVLDDDSSIRAWAYRRASRELFLRFSNGSRYRYRNVTRYRLDQFRNHIEAGLDAGTFFVRHWKLAGYTPEQLTKGN